MLLVRDQSIQDLKGASNYIPRGEVQLTLEQHGFEIHDSTYIWIFFHKYTGKHFVDLQQFEKTHD